MREDLSSEDRYGLPITPVFSTIELTPSTNTALSPLNLKKIVMFLHYQLING